MSALEYQQSPQDQALIKLVRDSLNVAEPYHKQWRKKANHHYALYRNYNDWKEAVKTTTTERGRDAVRRDGQKVFGKDLFIPWTFSVIETIVPRMLSNNPRMLILPGEPDSEPNVENMKYLIDRQQEQINFALKLQSVAKTGLIYGLGVSKVFWREKYRKRWKYVASEQPAGDQQSPYALVEWLAKVFDDPDFDPVDPFDFIWDPFAAELEDCEFIIHRNWRSSAYVRRMIESGRWRYQGDVARLLEAGASEETYDQVWAERNKVSGISNSNQQQRQRVRHEVLEFHDGEQVITILDRHCVVQNGPNPYKHGEYPFQIYRPTHLPNQFAGLGEVEPIEDLQLEINTLRSQRRDNAALVLDKVFAYMDGQIEEQHFRQWGPGKAIPVTGDPRELLFPIPVGDIPYSGYEEEQALKGDFQMTSGLSEEAQGNMPPEATATGVQLAQAIAGERIKNKTKRIEWEVVKPATSQFGGLNQQMILSNKVVRIGVPPTPEEPERRWAWRELSPLELAGEFEYNPIGGSMEPPNEPLRAQQASEMWTMFHNDPNVDQQWLVVQCLERLGIQRPQVALRPPEPRIPPETLDIMVEQLVSNGVKPDQAKAFVAKSVQTAMQIEAKQGTNGNAPAAPPTAPPPAQPQGAPA